MFSISLFRNQSNVITSLFNCNTEVHFVRSWQILPCSFGISAENEYFSIINHFGLSLQQYLGARVTVRIWRWSTTISSPQILHGNTVPVCDGRGIAQKALTNLSVNSSTVCLATI